MTIKTITILLVDDHKLLRTGIRSLIEAHRPSLEVIGEADDGRTAVKLAKQLNPRIVLMDISLPELNGVDATRRIVSECPGVKVIALTMHGERHFVVEMFRAGASGYLLKECAVEELVQVVRTVDSGASFICGFLPPSQPNEQPSGAVSWNELSAFSLLSPREREVLQLLVEGKKTQAISGHLGISVKTVETHRQRLMKKLGIDNIALLTKYAINASLTPLSTK